MFELHDSTSPGQYKQKSDVLLVTKFGIPRIRSVLLPRSHLIGRLEAATTRELVLVSTPAGFGKTTLLASWAGSTEQPVAWLSLNRGDNDPARFWRSIVAAVDRVHPGIGEQALSLLNASPQPNTRAVVTALVNELAAHPGELVLVLDDYHLIESPAVHDSLAFLLKHLLPEMHVLISSRSDPPIPLARFRARGQLAELHAPDLRFTLAEVAVLLQGVWGLNLPEESIAALEERTEGWVTGLQLAALSLQGTSDAARFIQGFTGSHRYILDYLTEEVLEQQPEAVRSFLLETSILEQLSGPLCDELTGRGDGQQMLEILERANLFLTPLDEERRWYRYHHLFADMLQSRLQQSRSDLLPELHRRAADWYARHEFLPEAIGHAIAGKDFERAAALIEQIAALTIVRGQVQTALGWLKALPDEVICTRPTLCAMHAAALMFTNQLEAATAPLKVGEQYVESSGEENEDLSFVRGQLAMTRATLVRLWGDLEQCVFHARRSLTLLPEKEVFWRASPLVHAASAYLLSGDVSQAYEREAAATLEPARATGNLFTIVRSITNLARLQALQGKLHQAAQSYEEALQILPGGLQHLIGSAAYYFGLGSLQYEWNELEATERSLAQGCDLVFGTLPVDADVIVLGYIVLARLCQAQGNNPGALAALETLEQLAQQRKFVRGLHDRIAAALARVWLLQGDLANASRWLERSGLAPQAENLIYPREMEHLTMARVLIAQARENPTISNLEGLFPLLDGLLQCAEKGGRTGSMIEILSVRALARHVGDDLKAAQADIARALNLAEPEGFVRLFIDEGRPMAALLHCALTRGVTADYTARLLGAFPTVAQGIHPAPPPVILPFNEPLSERELEVLRLLASGASNQEIAADLTIALSTARKHVSNIIGKLGVHNRTQAVSRGRDLGLL